MTQYTNEEIRQQAYRYLRNGDPEKALLTAINGDREDAEIQYILGQCYEYEYIARNRDLDYDTLYNNRHNCAYYTTLHPGSPLSALVTRCYPRSFFPVMSRYLMALSRSCPGYIRADIFKRISKYYPYAWKNLILWPLYGILSSEPIAPLPFIILCLGTAGVIYQHLPGFISFVIAFLFTGFIVSLAAILYVQYLIKEYKS